MPGRSAGAFGRREWLALGAGLLVIVAVRLVLLPGYVLLGDLDQYARWAHHLATQPFGSAYRQDFSYMPVLVAVFGAVGKLDPAFLTASDAADPLVRIALKIPALLGDAAIAAGLFMLLQRTPRRAALTIGAVLLVPASWYLGAWWGQLDSVYVALCLWAAILAVRDRPWWFALILGLALMTKPQALFLAAPFGGFAIGRWGLRRAVVVGLVALVVAAATWLPFLPYGGVAAYLSNLDYYQNGQYPFLSVRAWNLWWVLQSPIGTFVSDSVPIIGPLTPRLLGIGMTAIAGISVLIAVARRPSPDRLFLGMAAMTLLAFELMTSMHERYDYAALVFLAPLLGRRSLQVAWVALGIAISANIVAAAPPAAIGPVLPLAGTVGILGSLAIIAGAVIVTGSLLVGDRIAPAMPPAAAASLGSPSSSS